MERYKVEGEDVEVCFIITYSILLIRHESRLNGRLEVSSRGLIISYNKSLQRTQQPDGVKKQSLSEQILNVSKFKINRLAL